MPTRQTKPRKAGRTSQRRPASDASTKRLAWVLSIIIAVVVTYLITSAKQTSTQTIEIADNLETVVTNPSLPEKLINYTGMTVSFNAKTHQPNWVSWELLASEVSGDSERESQFTTDPNVDGCATTADYRNSGYDRGHMAPAGDMKWSPEAMKESFYLTNISPQVGDLNRGAWKKLEEKCRQRAEVDSALVIVCGPIFKDGEAVERIGNTGVAVPRNYFKVILSPYTNPPTAIGFIMPNGYVKGGMQACAVSVDSVEAVTGHDFFSALPDDIENKIEAECNFSRWSQIRRKR